MNSNSYRVVVDSPHESHEDFKFPHYSKPVHIRFGNTTRVERGVVNFNSVCAIENCRDKLKMKRIFERKGIPSPDFYTDLPVVIEKPLVLKRIEHSAGKGMQLIAPSSDPASISFDREKHYLEEWVECDTEFRCHVMNKTVFHIDKKILRSGCRDSWIKNLENYKYLPSDCFPEEAVQYVIKAVKAVGLVFGAVDVGVNTKTGKFYIYEVNSAPGMRTSLRKKYQAAIVLYLNSKWFLKKK
jgi:glutathione synthase/RimK-type ligase-like ATP-grasp enzyme